MPSGGVHSHMKGFSSTEDNLLMQLVVQHGPRWKNIAADMTNANPSIPRTAAMVRNRFLRVQKGKQDAAQGLARNKCGQCGQIKKGHVCPAVGNNEGAASMALQREAHEKARATSFANMSTNSPLAAAASSSLNEDKLPPIAQSCLELGSPPPLHFDPQQQENNAVSIFGPPSGQVSACAQELMPMSAASIWSPNTSPGIVPSPDITAASLLAPTPEGMTYNFPNIPIAFSHLTAPMAPSPLSRSEKPEPSPLSHLAKPEPSPIAHATIDPVQ